MRYHMIRTDDMLNGDGLRVVLFVAFCEHHCYQCHNPETWDGNLSKLFDEDALELIYRELDKDYISGITLSGGDPLNPKNLKDVYGLVVDIKNRYPNKTIWLYTGYKWEYIERNPEMKKIANECDVVVDGKFVYKLADVNYPWAGSTNQRVIDVKKTLERGEIVLLNK